MSEFSDLRNYIATGTGSRRAVCVDVEPPDERRLGGEILETAIGVVLVAVGRVVVGGQLTSADAQELASASLDFHSVF